MIAIPTLPPNDYDETDSSAPASSEALWPTPNAAGGTGYMSGSNRDTWRPTLEGMAQIAEAGGQTRITARQFKGKGRKAALTTARRSEQSEECVVPLEMWPTPQCADGERGSRTLYRGAGNPTLLGKVKDQEEAGALWPTPSACNANDGERAETWLARRERLKEKGYNGNGAGTPLAIAVQVPAECAGALWPTPRSGETSDQVSYPGHFFGLSAAVQRPEMLTNLVAPAQSTSSTAALLVNRVRQLVSAVAGTTQDGAGPSSSELLASWHRRMYWQRIQLALFPCDTEMGSRPLDEYSTSWPRWGTVAGGESGQPQMWALRTDATECSSSQGEQTWATPKSSPSGPDYARCERPEHAGDDLATQTARVETWASAWPTPTTQDGENNAGASQQQRPRPVGANAQTGSLNPAFVESLMGFPPGWTDIPGPPVPAKRSTKVKRRGLRTACRKE